jgi:LysR family hydrogen peroxide-inducible transcriptional activator
VAVETRATPVSLARFPAPPPSRTIGMIWRRSSPLAPRLMRIAEVVRLSAEARAGS